MGPPSAAAAIRESFGDRRLPDITRKITACVACRKRKVKCRMTDGKPPCSRCITRGLPCTVNKSIQMILEDDATWKEKVDERLLRIEASWPSDPNLVRQEHRGSGDAQTQDAPQSSRSQRADSTINQADNDVSLNLSCSLGGFPASSIDNTLHNDSPRIVTSDTNPSSDSTTALSFVDLLLTSSLAAQHFNFYRKGLDQTIHFVLTPSDTLVSVRSRSRFLATAVCAVAALCTNSHDCREWLNSFKKMVTDKTFSTHHSFDDVRALCVGAFWLSDFATALNALAVRLSSELNLHRCITKMPHKKHECYIRTRLYFLVYIVDHHCSISYGRPPMTRELFPFQNVRLLLQCEFSDSSRGDLALVSQVELWGISAQIFDTFGADIERETGLLANDIEKFNKQFEAWQTDWQPVLSPLSHLFDQGSLSSPQRSDVPTQLFNAYLSSAKLHLYSHAFRGPAQRQPQPPVDTGPYVELQRSGRLAVDSAQKVVNIIANMIETGLNPGVLPIYMATMTAFASVIILKTSHIQHLNRVNESDVNIGTSSITRLSTLLQQTLQHRESHNTISDQLDGPWLKITKGLEAALRDNVSHEHSSSQDHINQSDHLEPLCPQHHKNASMFHSPHGMLDANAFAVGLASDIDSGFLGDFDFEFDWMNFENLVPHDGVIDNENGDTFARS